MSCELTVEKEHRCAAMQSCPDIFISSRGYGVKWFWHFVENRNTLKERTSAHEIIFCPYCGCQL